MVEYGIGRKGLQWGYTMAINVFSGGKSHTVGNKDKKKLNFKQVRDHNAQSYLLGCMDFSQMLLALSNEISKLKGDDQSKFDLLLGELEIMYMESVNTFKDSYGLYKMPKATIEDIKDRTEKYSVDILDLNENTQTSYSETSQNTLQ